MAYAQPLIEKTDGSLEQMKKAVAISQACWNLALLPEEKRESAMKSLGDALSMDDAEFAEFQQSILLPMIARHEEMFPALQRRGAMQPPPRQPSLTPLGSSLPPRGPSLPKIPTANSSREKSSEPGRYDPCPCNSGRKYKFCCGQTARRT
jgi:hypothetical protein